MPTTMTSNRWPAFIIVLVAAFAAFSWWSIDRAASGVSAVSDPDYYVHGLKYHSAALDTRTAATTGWSVTPRLDGRIITIEIHDAMKRTITGCQAVISFPAGPAKESIAPLSLTDNGDGRYSGTLPAGLPPSVSTTLTLNKNQAITQRQILINQED